MNIPAVPPQPPPGQGDEHRCRQCRKKLFVTYLPPGGWIYIWCPRCGQPALIQPVPPVLRPAP